MPSESDDAFEQGSLWTSTQGTPNDTAFIDKIIKYKGVYYLSQPLDAKDSLKPRPASFLYSTLDTRIRRDWTSIERHVKMVQEISAEGEVWKIPTEKIDEVQPYWNNGYFSGDDAVVAYALTTRLRPKRIIEIGAGNSTQFLRKAISQSDLSTRIICIDPHPRAQVDGVADKVLPFSVLDVDLEVFDHLEPGDFLFWDGSHVVFNGSDVVRLFLEVLPRLKPGVIVHLHDISIPYEATHVETVGDVSYSEQYMLATYLLSNERAEIIMPVYLLVCDKIFLQYGRSFWFRTQLVFKSKPIFRNKMA